MKRLDHDGRTEDPATQWQECVLYEWVLLSSIRKQACSEMYTHVHVYTCNACNASHYHYDVNFKSNFSRIMCRV
jgi:hypothetical protein